MIVLAIVIASVGLLAALVTAAALVEMHDSVKLLQELAGITGEPEPISLPRAIDTRPSAHGLPDSLDHQSGLILFLSPKCQSCASLATSLSSELTEQIDIVVTAADSDVARRWITEFGLPADRCIVDADYQIADSMGIDTTPVGVVREHGKFTGAVMVANAASLEGLIEGAKV